MLLEKIKTPGLAHLSYLVGAGGEAAVIDPRRDCDIYLEKARAQGLEITHIFETHRNEDLVSGSRVLAEWTGAEVHHGPNPAGDVVYAKTAKDGDSFNLGSLRFEVIETPGHTDDHIAIAIYDTEYPEKAVGVFTGDALFIGDVGRADFYPVRAEEVAGLLHDSLQKIIALGDQAIVYPAHGAGSVCGSGMADREFSTVGHERLNNPMLQIESREEFVSIKMNETHYQPPYFRLMEKLNLKGGTAPPSTFQPRSLTLSQLDELNVDHVVDIREPGAFSSAHIPGSYCIPVSMIPSFAGWFVGEGDTIAFVAACEDQLRQATEHLFRIGLDNLMGGYVGIVPAAAQGHDLDQLPMIRTSEVDRRLKESTEGWTLLDVRSAEEREESHIEGSVHIYAGHLNERWRDLDPKAHYTVMCASGMRATVAASWLASKGFENVDVYLGSMGAWQSAR